MGGDTLFWAPSGFKGQFRMRFRLMVGKRVGKRRIISHNNIKIINIKRYLSIDHWLTSVRCGKTITKGYLKLFKLKVALWHNGEGSGLMIKKL